MESATFTNDNNVTIMLCNHALSSTLKARDNHEVLFRRINTFLIKNKLIKNNIIDLGAWIGDNSIPWSRNIDGIVYAIDPSQGNCEFIRETCKLNNITNVTVIQSAISNINERLSTNHDIQHCSFVYGNPGLNGRTVVDAVSLDYLFNIKMIQNIGYIHLDVEGMEYRIIQGSSVLIDVCRPIISFEQHLDIDDYNMISTHLKDKNYRVFLVDEILPGCSPTCRNFFGFPAELCSDSLVNNINELIGRNILIPK